MTNLVLYFLLTLNVVTFIAYGIDKQRARKGRWRISEQTLLLLPMIGGSVGGYLGMKIWRHKTQHKKFRYGLPAILIIHCAIVSFIFL